MSNQIRGPSHGGTVQSNWVPYVNLANGSTAVAVSVLAMAATALAITDSQRRLASAITTLDQSVQGRGAVGFGLTQLPWTAESFLEDRAFLVMVCKRAASQQDWHRLDYEPRTDHFKSVVARIAIMLRAVETDDLEDALPRQWSLMPEVVEETCERHHVFLHREGCVVCND